MPKVSVITPAYNAASFLQETVNSVRVQTFCDWEMIIVDDCSTDETYDLSTRIAETDKRIKVLHNDKNIGVAATRNKALDAAIGEYIAFLDADDLWLPQKLEKQVTFMDNGQYALTYTNYRKFDTNTGIVSYKIIKAPPTMTAKRIYGDTSIGCLTVMVNRSLSGVFHMPLRSHTEDNITWQEILSRGFTAHRLDDVLSLYREGNSSLTHGKIKAAKQQWQTYREYYKFSVQRSLFYFVQYAFHATTKHFF